MISAWPTVGVSFPRCMRDRHEPVTHRVRRAEADARAPAGGEPARRREVGRLGEVEAVVEAGVVGLGKRDDDLARALEARRERDARRAEHGRRDQDLLVPQERAALARLLGADRRREPLEAMG